MRRILLITGAIPLMVGAMAGSSDIPSSDANEALMHVISSSDTADANRIIDKADVNARGPDGTTPLALAAFLHKDEIVRQLIARGAKPDLFSNIALGRQKDVENAIRDDPALVKQKRQSFTPLFWAAACNRSEMIPLLLGLAAKIDEEYRDGSKILAIHIAAKFGAAESVIKLHEMGSKLEAADALGRTPLHYSASDETARVAKVLLDKGAMPLIEDKEGLTALASAARMGNLSVVQLLLDTDSNAASRARALVEAAGSNASNVVEVLCKRGVDVNSTDRVGRTPLWWAVRNQASDAAKSLLKLGAKHVLCNGESPLHLAARNDDAGLVLLLIRYGAAPYALDSRGRTAVGVARGAGSEAALKCFAELGFKE